jgi:hypothetical protein
LYIDIVHSSPHGDEDQGAEHRHQNGQQDDKGQHTNQISQGFGLGL